jgi:DNA invertase Pin-like site-specific DNA recombinase
MYGRVSTSDQVEGTSPEVQRQRCVARIESEGWEYVGEYFDEGVSGAKARRRKLDALMTECRAGNVDVVVVTKLDRFGRTNRHLENLLAELDDLGIRFVSLDESFDSTTSAGRFMRTMLGGAAEFERASIKERTMSGLLETARAGFWPGGPPPYGFKIVEAGRHKQLAIEEAEAQMLRTAVALIVDERLTTKEAADRLHALGMKPRKAARWTYHNLRRTLLDAPLSGEWVYARPRAHKQAKSSPPLPLSIPEVISTNRHEVLRTVLKATTNTRRRSNFYLLSSGRLIALCGARYQGIPRPRSDRRQYRCYASRTYAEDRCDCHRIDAGDAERAVWVSVADLLGDPDRLLVMAEDYVGLRHEQAKSEQGQLDKLSRRIKRLEEALGRAYEDRYRGERDRVAVDVAIKRMEEDLKLARTNEATAAAWEANNQAVAERVLSLRELAHIAKTRLANMTPQEMRRVLDLLDVRATVTAWRVCELCQGRGKVASKPALGGKPCPACHMSRWLPSLRIEGVVYERLVRDTLSGATAASVETSGLPFRFDEVSVA